jgi:predicted Zn-dependent peptidase
MSQSKAAANECMRDEWVLPNGLRVLGERMPHLRTVSIGAWMHVGSMMESETENGLSHFIEHMIFKGTEKRTTRQIAEEMDAVGGQLNAFTGKDCTCCYAKVIDEDIALAIDIIGDMVMNATIDDGELQKERGVVLEEISMDEDSPEDLVHDLLAKAQFGTQSLGRPILGTTALVSGYTRDDLVAYKKKHYCPKETVISLAGSYDPEQVHQLMLDTFGAWSNEGSALALPPQQVLTGVTLAKEKDTEQMHLCLGYPGFAYGEKDIFAASVMNNVLGGAMSSRLFQRIREELGMAYTIYTFPNSYQGVGTYGIYAGISPKNGKRVLDEIDKEVKRFLKDGMTDKEFRDSKTQLRAGYLMGLESTGSRMQAMGRPTLIKGKPSDYERSLKEIEAVTPEMVMAIAQKVLTTPPCLAVVGKGAEQFAEEVR